MIKCNGIDLDDLNDVLQHRDSRSIKNHLYK